jgi:orotidine-5'-phosphate decarboxylase
MQSTLAQGQTYAMIHVRLNQHIAQKRSWLCVGLDPDVEKIPSLFLSYQNPVLEFTRAVVRATAEWAVAYKPNLAFYEVLGLKGVSALETLMHELPKDAITIADAKRADIGNTSRLYAKAFFETWGFDAVTVPPYMGYDSIEPFLAYTNKLTFILCLTSNRGAEDFEEQRMQSGERLYEMVLSKAKEWNRLGNVGVVAGATRPEALQAIRQKVQEMCLLVPGVGAQGGTLTEAVHYSVDAKQASAVINIGRALIYPDGEFESISAFEQAVTKKAQEFVNQMRHAVAQ